MDRKAGLGRLRLRPARELSDRDLGGAYVLMGCTALAACVLASLVVLLLIGVAERPAPSPIEYQFRQRWTWMNDLAAVFVPTFPGVLIGLFVGRNIAERRTSHSLFGVGWSRLSALADRLIGVTLAGAIAGALLYSAVNPGPGLISFGVRAVRQWRQEGSFEGVGALILSGASVGWALGVLLTGLALRRRAADPGEREEPSPAGRRNAASAVCLRMGIIGLVGCAVGALLAWGLFGLEERPLELVRDPGPPAVENWDWLNEARHILVGSAIGLFVGLIVGRVLASRALAAARLDGMPFGELRRDWRWLVAFPVVVTTASFVLYERQNPDRVFDATLPIVFGVLLGTAFASLAAGVRLRGTRAADERGAAGRAL